MIIYSEKKKTSMNILELCLTLLINATALILATSIFKGIYISNFWYGILAAAVIMILNKTVKPFIKLIALPITIYTLGLFYPFVNVFILKIAGLLIGKNFIVDGWIAPFFVSIFISLFTIILDALITKQIVGDKK